MELILQLTEQGRFILNDVSTLFEGNSFGINNRTGASSDVSNTKNIDNGAKFVSMIPPIELFGSISKISVEIYQKNKTLSVHPIMLLNIVQPSVALNTVDKVQCRLMIQDLDILTTISNVEKFLKDAPFPKESDYDQRIVTCQDASTHSSERASLPAFLQVSVVLTDTNDLDLNVFVGRSVQVDLNGASLESLGRLSQMLPNTKRGSTSNNINNDQVTKQVIEQQSTVEEHSKVNLQLRCIDVSTKSIQVNYIGLQQTFSVSVYCHGIEFKTNLSYSTQSTGNGTICRRVKFISSVGHVNGLHIGMIHDNCDNAGKEMNFLSPMKMKIKLLVDLLK